MYKELDYLERGGVATITLLSVSPDNKLNHNNMKELIAAFRKAENNGNKVVVLTGDKGIFCGGGTIGDFRDLNSTQIHYFGQLLLDMIMTMKTLAIPIVAEVNGDAKGGGFSLMEACDIRICCEEASFAIPEIKAGFCPAVALVSVQHALGNIKAQWMANTGEALTAHKAKSLGLIHKITEESQLKKHVAVEVDRILDGNPTAYRVTKEIGFKLSESSLRNSFTVAIGKLVEFLMSEDAAENLNAKDEGREAIFLNA